MKKVLSLCLLLVSMIFMQAQINLGAGSTDKGHAPISTYYGYSYVQQIFSKNEINASAAGNITGLKFYLSSTATITNSDQWTVYVGHTTKSNFSSTTDWVASATLTQVFTGAVTNNNGEIEITFSTPFAYNNVDNLVVAAYENKSGYDSNGYAEAMLVYPAGAGSSLTFKDDSINPSTTAPPTANYRNAYKSVMTILGLTPSANLGCPSINAPVAGATGVSLEPTITWGSVNNASAYIISVGTTPGGTDIENNLNVGSVLTHQVSTVLAYGTVYYVTVTATDGASYSAGCGSVSFTTRAVACPTLGYPAADMAGVSTLPTFTWTAPTADAVDGYRLSIGTTAGGTDVLNNFDVGNVTSYTLLTPLANNTKYYYTVKSYIPTSLSTGCSERSFTTECVATTPAYSHGFATFPGDCWSRRGGGDPSTGVGTESSTLWYEAAFLNSGSPATGAATINLYYTNRSGWLLTPKFNLSAGNYRLKFDYGFTNWNSTSVVTAMGSDDSVQLVMSTDGGLTWTSIHTWDASTAGPLPNTAQSYVHNLVGVNGASVQFAFYGTDGTVDDLPDYNFFMDNFVVETIPSCVEPTSPVVSNVTAATADLAWMASSSSPANGYDIYYSTTNTAPAANATPNITGITGTTTQIPGLASNTQYYAWVRANCGSSQSPWTVAVAFKTQCAPVNYLYENFNSLSTYTYTLPSCWNKILGSSMYSQDVYSGGVTGNHIYLYSGSAATAAVIILPPFSNVNAGTNQIRFRSRVSSGTGALEVGYVTDITDGSTFTMLEAISVTNTSYTGSNSEYVVIVPNSVPANARLAIKNPGSSTSTHYIDDVYWEPIPTCFAPTDVAVSNVTANTVDVSWTPPTNGTPTGYEIYYSTSNTAPSPSTPANVTGITTTIHSVGSLAPGTVYYVWVRSVCTTTDHSSWSQGPTFTTSCVPMTAPYTFDFSSFPHACWPLASGGDPASGASGTDAKWFADGFLNVGTTGAVKINIWTSSFFPSPLRGWLKTPQVDLGASGAGKEVKFNYGVTAYNGTGASTMGSDDVVNFLISTDGGTTWNVLQTWNAANGPSNTSNTYAQSLSAYSGVVQFAFFGSDGTVADSQDFEFFVDDFSVANAQLSTSEVVKDKSSIKVYPNPFTEVLNISDIDKVKTVVVTDASGRVVKTIDKPEAQLYLADLNSGMYLVTLRMKDGTVQTVKAIKK